VVDYGPWGWGIHEITGPWPLRPLNTHNDLPENFAMYLEVNLIKHILSSRSRGGRFVKTRPHHKHTGPANK